MDNGALGRRYAGNDGVVLDSSTHLSRLLKDIERRKSLKSEGQRLKQLVLEEETFSTAKDDGKAEEEDVALEAPEGGKEETRIPFLGGHKFHNSGAVSVKPTLPKWLAEPELISTDLTNLRVSVRDIRGLDETLVRLLEGNGVQWLFPVQAAVVPWLLHRRWSGNCLEHRSTPRDLCVSAPTGSGKTLSYVLPIVQTLKNRFVPRIRAIVVVPVHELASQVANVFRSYTRGTRLRVESTTGGTTELGPEQLRLVRRIGAGSTLESKIDILVTTPGRLVQHLSSTKGFDVSHLKYLVIDEADRVMDIVQDDWMHLLERRLVGARRRQESVVSVRTLKARRQPQKLLFSATLSHDSEKLKELHLWQPALFTSSGRQQTAASEFITPEELTVLYALVPQKLKPLALWALVARGWNRVLCFAKSAEDAHKLCNLLSSLLTDKTVSELSSQLSPIERDEHLRSFAAGRIDLLVCSDVMARGVDIPNVDYVVSYDPPKHFEGHVHRAGRTGRAGRPGTALTFLDPSSQLDVFLRQCRQSGCPHVDQLDIPQTEFAHKVGDYKSALVALKRSVAEESKIRKLQLKRRKGDGHHIRRAWKRTKPADST